MLTITVIYLENKYNNIVYNIYSIHIYKFVTLLNNGVINNVRHILISYVL